MTEPKLPELEQKLTTRQQKALQELDYLAWLLDESIRLPGGFRIGLDGIVGLIPGVGDATGFLISFWLVIKARRAGASRAVQLKMLGNVMIEFVVGAVPVLGDIFDFWFKANRRNLTELRRHILGQR